MSKTSPENGSKTVKLRESLNFGLRILYAAGFFPMDERRVGSKIYHLHLLYSVCFLSTYIGCLIAQLLYFSLNWKNVNENIAMIPILTIQLACVWKLYIFWNKNSRITLLLDQLESDSWNQTHPVPCSLFYTLPVGIGLFAMQPLINGSLWLLFPFLGAPEVLLFPVKTWMPDNKTNPTAYYIALLFEVVVISTAAAAETAMNTMICGLMAHARAQLVVLRENLEAIGRGSVRNSCQAGGHHELTKNKMTPIGKGGKIDIENKEKLESIIEGYKKTFKNYYKHLMALIRTLDVEEDQMFIEEDGGEDLLRKISYSELKEDFVKCMEYHRTILEYVKEIEAVFTWVFFAQFALSTTIICSATLQITQVSTASVEFYFSIIFAVGMFFEMTIFCYFGDNIMKESSLLPEAIYKCDWLSSDVTFRRSMLIFMETSKIPITVSAGKFFQLSIQTFVNILKSSYSYYAVFKGFMGNEKTDN